MCRFVAVVCTLGGLGVTPFLAAEGPQWIWPRASRAAGESFTLEKSFSALGVPAAAQLRVATDFCEAVVLINGASLPPAGRARPDRRFDVARHVTSGRNRLEVRVRSRGGPAAVAIEVILDASKGGAGRVVSDASWRVDGAADVRELGDVAAEPWWDGSGLPAISAFDEYNQFKEASRDRAGSATPFEVADGFALEVVRRAAEDEGSWVSLEVDPLGRYLIGKEDQGILRLTVKAEVCHVEEVDDSIRGVQGLHWSDGALYAYANRSQAFYRMRDTTGDDRFDEVRTLMEVPGENKGDHGRHQVVAGPDGKLYLIHGDSVPVPGSAQSLVPRTAEFGTPGLPLEGHVARIGKDGGPWEIFASGIRNPYGLALHPDGELFTYDADNEASTGISWYRPTRILHLVQGGDYGWRKGPGVWPEYTPDSLPATVDIGKGSPTAIQFGTGSSFPPRYQRAMFALDWTYGRILVVHIVPQGASYVGHAEAFLRGRPLNVVDLDFDRDGSLLFVTGGRDTQSVLYRLSYRGAVAAEVAETAQQRARRIYSRDLRRLRKRLEALQGETTPETFEIAWAYLDHVDPWIRHAARVVLERQPASEWAEAALTETRPERTLVALLALSRIAPKTHGDAIWKRLGDIPLDAVTREYQSVALRIAQLLCEDTAGEPRWSDAVLARFEELFPSGARELDRELCSLLARHGSERVVPETLRLLGAAPSQIDALHYLRCLAPVRSGWSGGTREAYFRLVHGARLFKGDRELPRLLSEIEEQALEGVPQDERAKFEALLKVGPTDVTALERAVAARPFVRRWGVEELDEASRESLSRPDLARGKALYREALCAGCHRFGEVGRAFGPDLTAVSSRLGRRDLLEAIVQPSRRIATNHESYVIATRSGVVLTGTVVWNDFRRSTLHVATDPMRLDVVQKIPKADIVSFSASPVSPMPDGLLDRFNRQEILDLLAYLESAGR